MSRNSPHQNLCRGARGNHPENLRCKPRKPETIDYKTINHKTINHRDTEAQRKSKAGAQGDRTIFTKFLAGSILLPWRGGRRRSEGAPLGQFTIPFLWRGILNTLSPGPSPASGRGEMVEFPPLEGWPPPERGRPALGQFTIPLRWRGVVHNSPPLEGWTPKADGVVASFPLGAFSPGGEFEVLFHLLEVVATTMTVRNFQKP
jgi:hypothetical protein